MTQSVSITLSNSVVYVSGTVNGKDYTFTLADTTDNGTVWSAVVDRAANDIYAVEVTTIDTFGTASTVSTVIYYGRFNLITDRSANDVALWRELRNKGWGQMTAAERAAWAQPMKGAYNYTDLNRVGAALNYVRNRLVEYGYLPENAFTARTDWRPGEIPVRADLTKYVGYVSTVRAAFARFPTTPPAPKDSGRLNYRDANAIEQIVFDVDLLLTNMVSAWYFSGDLYCGEV